MDWICQEICNENNLPKFSNFKDIIEYLLDFIKIIESELKITAKKEFLPMQKGDVSRTFSDIEKAKKLLGYNPQVSVREGIKNFIEWYRDYYKKWKS